MTTYNTFPASPLPDLPDSVAPNYAVQETAFGDGYKQVGEDGINSRTDTVSLSWSDINMAERDVLIAFLSAHAPALPFYYTHEGFPQKTYTCKDWRHRRTNVTGYSVTASLVQEHGAG
jgi:phage-related protein